MMKKLKYLKKTYIKMFQTLLPIDLLKEEQLLSNTCNNFLP